MSTLTVNIAGTNYSPNIDSIDVGDIIEQRSSCKMVIQTDLTTTFSFGQRVTVTDSSLGIIFYGIINTDDYVRLDPQDILEHSIDCIDCTFDVDRLSSNEQYLAQYAGVIVADQHKRNLAAEGITASYALDIDAAQADFAAGTLSGTTATTTDSGDGCLQLSLAGSPVSVSVAAAGDFNAGTYSNTALVNGLLQPAPTNAIKMVATCTLSGAGNLYSYVQIWSGSQAIGAGYYFIYDIWIDSSSPSPQMGADLIFDDGSTLRDNFVYPDQQNISPHPVTNLTGLANGQWYHRQFWIDNFNGVSLVSAMIVCEADNPGIYTAWFKNIRITNSSFSTILNIFSTTLNTSQQISSNGYTNTSISVVNTYDIPLYSAQGEGAAPWTTTPSLWTSAAYSIDAVKVLQSAFLSYRATVPTGTQLYLKYSLDSMGTMLCSNNALLPNLPAGLNVASRSLALFAQFCRDPQSPANPELCPTLSAINLAVKPAYSMSKTDVQFGCVQASDWVQAGTTLTNVASAFLASKVLSLKGYVNNFNNGCGNYVLYGSGTPNVFLTNRIIRVQTTPGGDTRVKLVDPGQYQNFTLEVDVCVTSAIQTCVVYRTTGWQNANDTYAYMVGVTSLQLELGRGTNSSSGGGAFTQIGSIIPLTLTDGNWYRLKIVVNGSSHKIYINNNLLINATDSTYSAAGFIGLRIWNGTGSIQYAQFQNFGVATALSGTWVSPNISLSGAATYGTSIISWRDQDEDSSNCSILVEATINGGTNWYPCTSGAILPVLSAGQSLSGINLKIRITLTTTTACSMPGIDNLVIRILQAYSASGTRISPVLSLAAAGRAGATITAWNALTPTGTSLVVATSPTGSGSWTNVSSGDPIAGITSQTIPLFDTFSVNSSASYTSTHRTGGTNGTFVFDTTNSRVSVSGGTNAALLYTATSKKDVDVMLDIDQADQAGLCWRWVDANNFYELDIADASASSASNTAKLYKVVANVKTQLGSTAVIAFTRGTPHRVRVTDISTAIVVTLDGVSIITATDSAITSAGQVGLFSGTGIGRFYNFRILALGDDLSAVNAYTRTTLTSTDPTVTPQLLGLTLAALSPDIGIGALIPNGDYRNFQCNKVLDAVVGASVDSTWFVRPDKSLVAHERTADPAPWVLTGDDTKIVDSPHISNNGDHYRNREIITNVSSTISFTDRQTGDGQKRTWTLKYKLASAPIVLLNGQSSTIGLKGTSGNDFYYEVGSDTLTQDNAGTILESNIDFLDITATGKTTTTVVRDNTGAFPGTVSQAQFATITGGTGIVTSVEDGTGMNVAQAQMYGDGLLQEFGKIGRTFQFKTERGGLKAGQWLSAINQKLLLNDASLLITKVGMSYWTSASGSTMQFQVEACEGPNVGSWQKVIESSLK